MRYFSTFLLLACVLFCFGGRQKLYASQDMSMRQKVILFFAEAGDKGFSKKNYHLDFIHSLALLSDLEKVGALAFSNQYVILGASQDSIPDEQLQNAFEFIKKRAIGKTLDNVVFILTMEKQYFKESLKNLHRKGLLKRKRTLLFRNTFMATDDFVYDFFSSSKPDLLLLDAIDRFMDFNIGLPLLKLSEEEKRLNEYYFTTLRICISAMTLR